MPHHFTAEQLLLLSAIGALILGAGMRLVSTRTKAPYSVLLLLLGLGIGLLERYQLISHVDPIAGEVVNYAAGLEPRLLLFLFLPILVFQSALALDPHLFRRLSGQITWLALPGVLLAAAVTAVAAKYLLPWEWSWPMAIMFGVLISATDPVSVVAMIHDLSSHKRLAILVEGESLLNDGTAIVLFLLIYEVLSLGSQPPILAAVAHFLYVVLGGLLVGWLAGWLFLEWIARISRDPLAQLSLVLACVYFGYMLAEEILHVSGVVSMVSLGLYLATYGKSLLNESSSDFLVRFWGLAAHMANTVIFLLVGIVIAMNFPQAEDLPWLGILIAYVVVILARGLMLLVFYPILRRSRSGFKPEKGWVLFWGGLRGAVALALALILSQDSSIPEIQAQQLLFVTAGVVVLTIVINGSTMGWLFRYLRLDRLSPERELTFKRASAMVDQALLAQLHEVSEHDLLRQADWPNIARRLKLERVDVSLLFCPLTSTPALERAFARQLLEAERQSYWRQYREGYISRATLHKLTNMVELALDADFELNHKAALMKLWHLPLGLRLSGGKWQKLRQWLLRFSLVKLIELYDLARGFNQAQSELLELLPSLAPNKASQEPARRALLDNQRQIQARIDDLRASFPEVAHTLETMAATRVMLLRKAAIIEHLAADGVMEHSEAEKLLAENAKQMLVLADKPIWQAPPSLTETLSALSLFQGLPESSLARLAGSCQRRVFGEGTLIARQGRKGGDFMLLNRGRVEVITTQDGHISHMSTLSPGELICPRAILTGINEYTAKVMMPVEIILIPNETLCAMMAEDANVLTVLRDTM